MYKVAGSVGFVMKGTGCSGLRLFQMLWAAARAWIWLIQVFHPSLPRRTIAVSRIDWAAIAFDCVLVGAVRLLIVRFKGFLMMFDE